MESRELDEDLGLTIDVKKRKDGLNEIVDENATATEEVEEDESVVLTLPDEGEDNEEAVDLTPEQLQQIMLEQEEQARAIQEKVEEKLCLAAACLGSGDSRGAEEHYVQALEIAPSNVKANVAYAALRTDNFTAFEPFEDFQQAVEYGLENGGDAFRFAVKEKYADPLFDKIKDLSQEAAELKKQVEEKKAERKIAFKRDYLFKKRNFTISLFPLVIFAVLSIIFGFNIAAVVGSLFLILTIVFAALTLVSFGVFLLCSNRLNTAQHRLALNEVDESTALGREYLALRAKVEFISNIVK